MDEQDVEDRRMDQNEQVDQFVDEYFEEFVAKENPYLAAVSTYREQGLSRFDHIGGQSELDDKIWGETERFYFRIDEMHTFRKHFGWAIPTMETIDELVDYSPIVEIGAGNGYWAWMIEENGGDVFAYDREPPEDQWTSVEEGTPETIEDHPDATLLLVWPHYAKPMASDCLEHYENDVFFFVGEGEGGATGDDEFHERLDRNWEKVNELMIPQYMGVHDTFKMYRRL